MKTALILFCLVTFSAISFGEGLAFERPPVTITKTVTQIRLVPINLPLHAEKAHYYGARISMNDAIPSSALREVRK